LAAKDARSGPDWFAGEKAVVGILGLLSVMTGAVVAYLAKRFPAHIEALETGAGALLLGGLALASCGLPIII
jgi:hypothetical protein